ncbi:MAG: thermonuclease family protein [Candidatus Nanoarchaeia archaeon]|nr:thermonuclease family protein [Candidatus Nanoarchaeia archaeon]
MKWIFVGLIIGFLVGFFMNFSFTGEVVNDSKMAFVTKIVDGDTLVIEGGDHVRLLGIDTDERGHTCYDVAKERLSELVLGKEVNVEFGPERTDQYGRLLAYILLDGDNINLRMISEGYAVARFFPGNEKYKEEIVIAEKNAILNKIGCKWNK